MPETTNLAVDGETTMRVVARFQNTSDVTGPYDGEEQSLNVKINAEQGTGSDGMTTTFTGTVYRNNNNVIFTGDNINDIESVWVIASSSTGIIHTNSDIYKSEEECQNKYENINSPSGWSCQIREKGLGSYTEDASMLNKTYYLKHDIVEDVITNSYVCFVYNNTEHCMKGADGGTSFEENTSMIKGYQSFNNLGNYNYNDGNPTGCNFASNRCECFGGTFYNMGSRLTGYNYIFGNSTSGCLIIKTGYSYCVV